MTADQAGRAWRGCMLAAKFASYYHDAHDFASITLCGMRLAGSGLSESHVTSAMRECADCARMAAEHAGHGADDCPLNSQPIPDTPYSRQIAAGHRIRTGHELDARLVPSGEAGIWRMQRACCHDDQETGS